MATFSPFNIIRIIGQAFGLEVGSPNDPEKNGGTCQTGRICLYDLRSNQSNR